MEQAAHVHHISALPSERNESDSLFLLVIAGCHFGNRYDKFMADYREEMIPCIWKKVRQYHCRF